MYPVSSWVQWPTHGLGMAGWHWRIDLADGRPKNIEAPLKMPGFERRRWVWRCAAATMVFLRVTAPTTSTDSRR
jgi:hypothetical protein